MQMSGRRCSGGSSPSILFVLLQWTKTQKMKATREKNILINWNRKQKNYSPFSFLLNLNIIEYTKHWWTFLNNKITEYNWNLQN